MPYPDDKDTFRRVEGYVGGDFQDVNKLKEGDQNNMAQWLEDLQDIFGYGIKMGYATVKAFFDWIVTTFGTKVDDTGDTMTGDLELEDSATSSPYLFFTNTSADKGSKIVADGGILEIFGYNGIRLKRTIDGGVKALIDQNYVSLYKPLVMNSQYIKDCANIEIDTAGDFENKVAGRGMICRTPDNTKSYRVSVDNAGNVISTLI